jgi:hypothetical protein
MHIYTQIVHKSRRMGQACMVNAYTQSNHTGADHDDLVYECFLMEGFGLSLMHMYKAVPPYYLCMTTCIKLA